MQTLMAFQGIQPTFHSGSLQFQWTLVALNQLVHSCMKGLEDYYIFHSEMCFKYPVTLNSSLENVELPSDFLFWSVKVNAFCCQVQFAISLCWGFYECHLKWNCFAIFYRVWGFGVELWIEWNEKLYLLFYIFFRSR